MHTARKLNSNNMTISGVDLNRNYGYHYGETRDDLNPCSETYRGPTSFSEPETRAIRNLIEKEKTIASAMNFHCYGNIWIHPFNYMTTAHKYPINAYKDIINFYEEFKHEVAKVSKADYGNAIETVDYSTDGEGSDWMLGEYKIVAFSPELGSFNNLANTFFLPKDLISEVINENYKVIELFIKRNNFEMKDLVYGINNKGEFTISFTNRGLANIFAPRIVITSSNTEFLKSVTHVNIRIEDNNHTGVDITDQDDIENKGLSFELPQINRLDEFSFNLKIADSSLLRSAIFLNVEILMADGSSISKFDVNFEYDKFGGLFTMTLLGLIFIFSVIMVMFGYKIRKLSKEKSLYKAAGEKVANVPKIAEVASA